MRLHVKTNLFLLAILLPLSLIILVLGVYTLNKVVKELSSELLSQQVEEIHEEVEDAYYTLQRAGVVTSPQYIRQAQTALFKRFRERRRFFESEEVLILSLAGEVLMHPSRDYRSLMPEEKMRKLRGEPGSQSIFHYQGQEGSHYVMARALFPAWEWLLLVRVSEDEIYAKRNQYVLQMTLFSLAFLLLTLFIARRLAGKLVKATNKALHCINQAAEGKLSARIQGVRGQDEMANLAQGINAMLARREVVESQLVQANVQIQQVNRELQQALTQAQQMSLLAEQASGAKSRFLAMMSHELRTPLNAILGYAQVLQQHPQAAPVTEGLASIQDNSEYLLALINNLLDLAKIEAGKLELTPQRFAVAEWLASIERQVTIKAHLKGLALECDYQHLPAWVEADPVKLKQILLNLLSNAVKFTEQGQVCLQAHWLQSDTLMLAVEDTGCGIEEAALERIFNPFEQQGEQLHKHMGTGLGLAISQQLVRLMGSELKVESTPGQGSRFYFQLQLMAGGELAPQQPSLSSQRVWPTLPAALYRQLQESVRLGNMQQVTQLSQQIANLTDGAVLAQQLATLAQQYRSRELSVLIEQLAVQSGQAKGEQQEGEQ
ncbi:sensor histidine kinase [Balneatrix alpica]|uniref:histidine kinase n=1 Tax=Balneatrix alpica TaxID=75684 RepID=A0ABV5Z9B2_9GAMM|nr:ATP-binding protein [Balneatrix alpica]